MNNRTLYILFHNRFPSEKAAAVHIAESCNAYRKVGEKVVLVVPRRLGRFTDDPMEYYNIRHTFKIVYVPTIDVFLVPGLKKIAFYLSLLAFSVSCFLYMVFQSNKQDVFYSNDHLPLFFLALIRKNCFYEVHDYPEHHKKYFQSLLNRMKGVVTNNFWKREQLAQDFDLDTQSIHAEPNAVTIADFDILMSQMDARKQLDLPQDKKIIVYTGNLFTWKGVDTLAEAAQLVPENTLAYVIGGSPTDLDRYRKLYGAYKQLVIVGFRARSEMAIWQCAADVLVLPNTAKEDISKYYTSPMKLFEYMASRRPIVGTNIPSLTQILNQQNSILVEPDDAGALAKGIEQALNNDTTALVDQARIDVEAFTWEKRAQRIIHFLYQ